MSSNLYPKLDEAGLKTAHKFVVSIPGYLEDPACPYTDFTKTLLAGNRAPARATGSAEGLDELAETVEAVSLSEMDDSSLMQQIDTLYGQIQSYGSKLDKADTSGHNTFFRISFGMLEKVVSLRTKMSESVSLTKFIEDVLSVMEDVMTAEQRDEINQRLHDVYGKQK